MVFPLNTGWRSKTKQPCLFDAVSELNHVRLISASKKSYYNIKNNNLNSGADLIPNDWLSIDFPTLFQK